ncbi:suppressor of cytokine signaling 7 isoform X2 [Phyllopteryx taeniolatus]|uniref:suppressor of cytokine signaling 7 isoform X2 n=1 Tax=Phyllopteryx taeniolatus TaxID=161469 RepID=UPI002AD21965|nr:suppressor of cytokine signaling 7 isoform X2 [Phyllopteryx taeniolatus]XP_061626228.1 suppressor of cytokine signaling 7 isoform X2 [Phyllopteryx taeniolatus]
MANDAQEISPDFVLMRLVSAAEEDRPDAESGAAPPGGVAVAGLGREALAHKAALELSRDAGLERNKAPASGGRGRGPAAPDVPCAPPRPLSPAQAPGCEFGPGLRPQLLVFSDLVRSGDGILELNERRTSLGLDLQNPGAGCSEPTLSNNTGTPEEVQQHMEQLDGTWGARPPVPGSTEQQGSAEVCHGHRLLAGPPKWPSLSVGSTGWTCTGRDREGAVLELARRFGELGVGAVPKMLLKAGELPHCACQRPHAPGEEDGDDPAVTSDALLVLEGLGLQDQSPDDRERQRHFLVGTKPELEMSSFRAEVTEEEEVSSGGRSRVADPLLQASPWTGSQASTPRRRPERCASAPRTPGAAAKTAKPKKGSLRVRLSRLFRTKSCSGSSHLLDRDRRTPVGGQADAHLSASGPALDSDSLEHEASRLSRAHSAFSPTSLAAFTGETVSLVDVDISRRGTANTPHPPTPPPPPRRSLSLLDDISGPQSGGFLLSVMGASLQSLPLPLPPPAPPSHATMHHSLSLNDAFLRVLPHSNPSQADAPPSSSQAPPPMLCALRRSEASNFTASLRELEKCGWYWGPMNWEDAEMKLKGKPDGSFLVRDSSDPRYILSLSFRSQGVTHHTRMEHYRGTFSLWCHPKFEDRCHSVVEFIERAIMHSKNGKFLYFLRSRVPGLPPTPVQLLYPVSRFSNVKSLQHLCRFCIRQIVRIDHIQQLPLPRSLVSYLSKFYYYDPEEEMYLSIKSIRPTLEVHT